MMESSIRNRKSSIRILALLIINALIIGGSLTSCVTEDVLSDTPSGNFEALWRALDEHYCFFAEKKAQYGLDWDEVHERYAKAISSSMSDEALFQVCGKMLLELRDGHVNLYAAHDIVRYADWYDAYPTNYADTLLRAYLGRAGEYRLSGGIRYRVLRNNIGYMRCATFENELGDGNLSQIMYNLGFCSGLIVDVRSNGGGMLSSAQKLASLFLNEPADVGYMCHKTGPAHDAFSEPEAIHLNPFPGLRWQKPVVILANRGTFSAANSFIMYLKGRPNITIMGDRTGGGGGLPLSFELPGGWSLRMSACPMYDSQMNCTEEGIEPDISVMLSSEDFQRTRDTLIESAIDYLSKKL